jgi:hypothetical protein
MISVSSGTRGVVPACRTKYRNGAAFYATAPYLTRYVVEIYIVSQYHIISTCLWSKPLPANNALRADWLAETRFRLLHAQSHLLHALFPFMRRGRTACASSEKRASLLDRFDPLNSDTALGQCLGMRGSNNIQHPLPISISRPEPISSRLIRNCGRQIRMRRRHSKTSPRALSCAQAPRLRRIGAVRRVALLHFNIDGVRKCAHCSYVCAEA